MKTRPTNALTCAKLSSLVLSLLPSTTLLVPVSVALIGAQPAIAENLSHTQQLLATKACSECDLSTAGLAYADLKGVNLSRTILTQANLSHANLSGANLSGANLSGAILVNVDLSGADLSQANLQGADLRGAILTGATWTGARVEQANLLDAIDLPGEFVTIETLYRWGMEQSQRGNYPSAVQNYSQAIERQPDLAPAYLARGIARFRLGDRAGALQDADQAEQLYKTQGNAQGQEAALHLSQGIKTLQENSQRANRGGGGGGNFLGFLGSVASLLLRFVLP